MVEAEGTSGCGNRLVAKTKNFYRFLEPNEGKDNERIVFRSRDELPQRGTCSSCIGSPILKSLCCSVDTLRKVMVWYSLRVIINKTLGPLPLLLMMVMVMKIMVLELLKRSRRWSKCHFSFRPLK